MLSDMREGTWGGARNFAFSQEEEAVICLILFLQVRRAPCFNLQQYVDVLRSFGFATNKTYVWRYFKSIGLSHKKLRLRAVRPFVPGRHDLCTFTLHSVNEGCEVLSCKFPLLCPFCVRARIYSMDKIEISR